MVVLGTGSGQKGDVQKAVELWLQAGGVGFDTAYDYNDEGAISDGVAAAHKPRSGIFIETKVPCTNYSAATAHLYANLAQLKVEHVDLVLSHHSGSVASPCDQGGSLAETWRALEDFAEKGKTKAIGVSHATARDLEGLRSTARMWPPAVNQCKFSIISHDDESVAYCREHGITYQSFSPLCGGFNGSSCSSGGGRNVMTVPAVIDIAAKHHVSPAQVGLKWIVQQGLPLTTAVWRLDYMKQDLDLWSWGNLTSDEMRALSAVANQSAL